MHSDHGEQPLFNSVGDPQTLSTHMAMPIPPPMQSEATPLRPPVLCRACTNVTSTLQPDMPMGWPREMEPPLTFTWRRRAC